MASMTYDPEQINAAMSQPIAKSFFVGRIAGRAFERRRAGRWLWAIITRGNTETLELAMIGYWLAAGALLMREGYAGMPDAHAFGTALVYLSIVGFIGLSTRSDLLRALFGILGFFLRFWMAAEYFRLDWRDPLWTHVLGSSIVMLWVFLRVVCRHNCRRRFQ